MLQAASPMWSPGVVRSPLFGSRNRGEPSNACEGKMAILRITRLRSTTPGAIDTGNGPALLAARTYSRRAAGTRLSRGRRRATRRPAGRRARGKEASRRDLWRTGDEPVFGGGATAEGAAA